MVIGRQKAEWERTALLAALTHNTWAEKQVALDYYDPFKGSRPRVERAKPQGVKLSDLKNIIEGRGGMAWQAEPGTQFEPVKRS
jgi:hypothetical protein